MNNPAVKLSRQRNKVTTWQPHHIFVNSATCLLFAASFFVLLIAPVRAEAGDEDLFFEFRGKPLPNELELTGKAADQYVKMEPSGLRVTLPKDRKNLAPVGVRTTLGVSGDFEITATVEILQAEAPVSASSFGTGVSLYLEKVDPPGEGTNIGRLVRAEGKDLILWDRKIVVPGAQPKYLGSDKRCTDKLVRLRLVRAGSKLTYLWAPGGDGDFQKIHHEEFGSGEIKDVTVRVTTGGEPRSVDVRFIDLRIRSGGALQSGGHWGLTPALFVGLVGLFLVIALGLWLMRHRRAVHPVAKTEPAQTAHSFPCPECGKKLKTKAEMAGKKIKCPECSKTVLVPGS